MRAHGISLALATLTTTLILAPASAQTAPPSQPAQTRVVSQPTQAQPRPEPKPHNIDEINHNSPTPTYHYSYFPPIPVQPSHPNYYEPAHRSVMRHDPLPPASDRSWGVRNPGGAGRMAEYYPPENKFQNANARVPVATFDSNNTRAEQQASQALGIQRANSIQNNINHYAGGIGYGYGFGFGGVGFPN